MKKKIFILSTLIIGAIFVIITSCEKDPAQACVQDLFCDGATEVTACCTDGADCHYTYNGIEYPDTEEGLADLAAALDCATTKSIAIDGENSDLVIRLQALLEEARIMSKQK